jgi:nitroimidazol reductase NimA-like FMN-containing flavoprotein (pyridoxamine 5'-phosphate oxidase superfamily)
MTNAGGPPVQMVLEEIDRDESLRLLQSQSMGRLAVADHGAYPPHIVPVNFIVEGDHVIFRSNFGLKFQLSVLAEHSLSFEADLVDDQGHMAWSVVVQGRAELLTQEEIDALPRGSWLHPWAPGERKEWVRIVPYTVSGRRVRPVPYSAAAEE